MSASAFIPPVGRCPDCGVPTYSLDDLNFRCDICGEGVVASTATQDWAECPACGGTGASPICPPRDPSCPVCCGTGWITDEEAELAVNEAATISDAVAAFAIEPRPLRPERLSISRLGSASFLRRPMSEEAANDFLDALSARQNAWFLIAERVRKARAADKRSGQLNRITDQ
jgi:hypothetical protein